MRPAASAAVRALDDLRRAHEGFFPTLMGADAALVSPLHPTRSHPGAAPLGRAQWLRLARAAGGQAVALGGMTPARARALARASAASGLAPGWAAIDAWEAKAATRKARRALAR